MATSPVVLVLAALLCACSSAPSPVAVEPSRAPPAPRRAVPPPEPFEGGATRVDVHRQGVRIRLPDRARWQGRAEGTSTSLRHEPTNSTLRLKAWRAARLVRASDCAREAALFLPASPEPRAEEILEERALEAPPTYDGWLRVFVREVGAELEGRAELVAAGLGRCLSVVYVTRASGESREREVGGRLDVFANEVFPSLEEIGVEHRVR